jgi:hypothetical protein
MSGRRRPPIAPLLVLVLVAGGIVAGAVRFWNTRWQYATVGAFPVRSDRVTSTVEFRPESGGRWEAALRSASTDDPVLSADALRTLSLRDLAWGPGGLLVGRLHNASSGAISGKLVFRLTIRAAGGEVRADRELRKWVSCPPGRAIPFLLKTGMNSPVPGDKARVTLGSVH